jgi:hypothetical protein
MLPFVNAFVTLLQCIYLMQSLHHTLLDLISNDAKLIMADGAYKDFRRPSTQHP